MIVVEWKLTTFLHQEPWLDAPPSTTGDPTRAWWRIQPWLLTQKCGQFLQPLTQPLTHSTTYPPIHSPTHSLTHSLTHSINRLVNQSLLELTTIRRWSGCYCNPAQHELWPYKWSISILPRSQFKKKEGKLAFSVSCTAVRPHWRLRNDAWRRDNSSRHNWFVTSQSTGHEPRAQRQTLVFTPKVA